MALKSYLKKVTSLVINNSSTGKKKKPSDLTHLDLAHKAWNSLIYLSKFIPRQKILRRLMIVVHGEKWKKSSWQMKSQLIVFYLLFIGGGIYLAARTWWTRRSLPSLRAALEDQQLEVDSFDVCIVGGGVSGATCAYYLAQRGRRVLLLEREEYPRAKCCAGVLTPQAQQHLKDMGIYRQLFQEKSARWINTGGMVSYGGESFVASIATITAERLLSVGREVLDETIARAAVWEGATLICRAAVEDVRFSAVEGVWDVFYRTDGVLNCRTAQVLVAADGAESSIARKLGVVTTGPTGCASLVTAIAEDPSQPHPDWLCILSDSLRPFRGYSVIVKRSTVPPVFSCCLFAKGIEAPQLEQMHMRLLREDPVMQKALGRVAFGQVRSAPLRGGGITDSVRDHFLCVGEASGQGDPLTGEGIQYAMDSAKDGAEALNMAFAEQESLRQATLRRYLGKPPHFRGSRFFGWIGFRYPWIVNAAARAIQKRGRDFLHLWFMMLWGGKSKLWCLRPDLIGSVIFQVLMRLLRGNTK